MIDEKKLIGDLIPILNKNDDMFLAGGIIGTIDRQPQVGGVEINKDFETILLCAVRYAIGRETYMPSLVIDYITPLLSHLSYNTLGLIANDITEYGKYYGDLGDEKIDRPYWLNFKRKILAEMERRGNEDTEQMGKESH